MSSRSIKKTVLRLLGGNDVRDIMSQVDVLPAKDVIHALFSAICRTEENVRWQAVRAMGRSVARLAGKDMEEARIVMRRLLWSLNDESGGIGWGAPEAMAEIMIHHQGLAEEYMHMLISYMREDGDELFQNGNFLENKVLQRGLLWGMGRLAAHYPRKLLQQGADDDLLPYLDSTDPAVRGLAARALGLLRSEKALQPILRLLGDNAMVHLYEDDRMHSVTVDALALQALERIKPTGEN